MGRVTHTYDYPDATGWIVRRKHRWEPKSFTWECQTEEGWNPGKGNSPLDLYRLPEVIAAVRAGETVTVCEGEKDADSWVEAGWGTATTPPENGVWPPGLAAPLAGADVMVIWDRDDDGAKRGQWAKTALEAVGAQVTCYRVGYGNDVSDFIAAGKDDRALVREDPPKLASHRGNGYAVQAEIERAIDSAGEFGEEVKAVLDEYLLGSEEITWLSEEELLKLPSPRWLIDGWIPEKGMVACFGVPGVGKTFLAEDLADSVRRGRDWNGYTAHKGGAMIISGEGLPALKDRRLALLNARGRMNGASPVSYTQDTWDITTAAGIARLVVQIRQFERDNGKVGLVVVDPVGLYGAKTREGVEDTEAFAQATRAVGLRLNLCMFVLQHANASGDRGRGTDHIRMYSEAYMKLEPVGSRECGLFHDGKVRGSVPKAIRFSKEPIDPSMILVSIRGMAGDEYTPDEFVREQAERRNEAKQRNKTAAAFDPDNQAKVLNILAVEGEGDGVSLSSAGRLAGIGTDTGKDILAELVKSGRAVRREGARNAWYHWKTK